MIVAKETKDTNKIFWQNDWNNMQTFHMHQKAKCYSNSARKDVVKCLPGA